MEPVRAESRRDLLEVIAMGAEHLGDGQGGHGMPDLVEQGPEGRHRGVAVEHHRGDEDGLQGKALELGIA